MTDARSPDGLTPGDALDPRVTVMPAARGRLVVRGVARLSTRSRTHRSW